MKVFYTSDHHFGHKNIIKYCNRPFSSVDLMNEQLIKNWNSIIQSNDIVVHLGDVYFKDWKLLGELNGFLKLILGNHDIKNTKTLEKYFEIEKDQIVVDHESQIVLCHYPIYDWPMKYHNYILLHGHSHGTVEGYQERAIDVGIDCWNYFPTTLSQIRERIASRHIAKHNNILRR